MSNPFIGEIRMFGGSYPPVHWSFCNGQYMAISQNDALFALLGTTYGGDGRTNFALPDMRGRLPVHQGDGIGLTRRTIGQRYGTEQVTLQPGEIPTHNHVMQASKKPGTTGNPANMVLAKTPTDYYTVPTSSTPATAMQGNPVQPSGGGQPHYNIMPFQTLSFIISLTGVFPSRN